MQLFKTLILLSILFSNVLFAQEIITEKDYTLHYIGETTIEIQFNKVRSTPTNIQVYNVTAHQGVTLEPAHDKTKFVINNIAPAQVLKLEYRLNTDKSSSLNTTYLASKSLSTGTINVFFNHPVDTTASIFQNAVNLSNTLDDRLITYINACTSTLDIAIYNSYSTSATSGIAGAINAAYARGVQIRVIYDGSTSSQMIPLLNTNIPILPSPTSSSYGIMHNKFVIFDADSADPNQPLVWAGSTNWTVAQIDGPDLNSVIAIQDQALAQGYKIEFEEMWGSNTLTPNTTVSKFGPYKVDNTPHHYVIGGKNIDSYFSPSDGANAQIIAAINTANTDVEVATMLITRTDINSAINNKFVGGVSNVNIVVDSQNPSGNQISILQSELSASRAVVYSGAGIMHHKFMVVDNFNSASDPLVLLGSHNWSTSAETKNDENMLIVHDLNIANQYYQAFSYIFQLAGGTLTLPSNNLTDSFLNIVPNPSSGLLTIMTKGTTIDQLQLTVYDVLGKTIKTLNYTQFSSETIDISDQANGLYFIQAKSNDAVMHYKIIKQ
ncbi:phospholipase D-like domain-containing protein [Flavobacterium sp. SUN046]|uniref:phospholipase D-like domain-containing protein n=1 Tax=Flavobacterium sp. SUN046 TaxID=3002440 RepID=UPI002DBB16E4|nr:phospholipase D-like domain-containing protein [Flavobacterium sp. SUN046]MEC4049794.1 phospholipase D-like domain-containing protein [Flavobacterium sp. SUN046]